jgi:hypothetical protein
VAVKFLAVVVVNTTETDRPGFGGLMLCSFHRGCRSTLIDTAFCVLIIVRRGTLDVIGSRLIENQSENLLKREESALQNAGTQVACDC